MKTRNKATIILASTMVLGMVSSASLIAEAQAQTIDPGSNTGVTLKPGTVLASVKFGSEKITSIRLWGSDGGDFQGRATAQDDDVTQVSLALQGNREYTIGADNVRVDLSDSPAISAYYTISVPEKVFVKAHEESDLSDVVPLDLQFEARDLAATVNLVGAVVSSVEYSFQVPSPQEPAISGSRKWPAPADPQSSRTVAVPVQAGVELRVRGRVYFKFADGTTGSRFLSSKTVAPSDDDVSWDLEVKPDNSAKASASGVVSVSGTDVVGTSGGVNFPGRGLGFSGNPPKNYSIDNLPVREVRASSYVNFADSGTLSKSWGGINLVEGPNEVNFPFSVLESTYSVGFSNDGSEAPDFCSVTLESTHDTDDRAYYSQSLQVEDAGASFPLKLVEGDWKVTSVRSRFRVNELNGDWFESSLFRRGVLNSFSADAGGTHEGPSFKFSRAVVTFDVEEPDGAATQVQVSNPRIFGSGILSVDEDYSETIEASSSASGDTATVVVWGIPNRKYEVKAEATTLGSRTIFAQTEIKFFPPEKLVVGPGTLTLNNDDGGQCRKVELSYQDIETEGNGVITPLPLGAKPPKNFYVYFNGQAGSDPQHYNISLSAVPKQDSKVEVCIWFNPEKLIKDGIFQRDLRLGQYVKDAESQADCPEGSTFLGKGWCDIRVEGSSYEEVGKTTDFCGREVDHTQVLCGQTDANSFTDAAILVPIEAPKPSSGLNCTPGDVVENGVVVEPGSFVLKQYNTGMRVGEQLSAIAWSGVEQDDPTAVDYFIRTVTQIIESVYLKPLEGKELTTSSKCRVRGILQGVANHVNDVTDLHGASCKTQGSNSGALLGETYCMLMQAFPGADLSKEVIPVFEFPNCSENFTEGCQESFISQTASMCTPFTLAPYTGTYETSMGVGCSHTI